MRALAITLAAAPSLILALAVAVSVPGAWIVVVTSFCAIASAILAIVLVLRSSRRVAGLACGGLAVVCAAAIVGAQVELAVTKDPEPVGAAEVLLVSMVALIVFVAVAVSLTGSKPNAA